ncbi:MAG TPA: hypothetical protein VLD62_01210 [Acidimicrobiia bacterium]|nr:hypothetical protein [Acidimicrobiia bacterium]
MVARLEISGRTDGIGGVALVGELDVAGLHAVDLPFRGAPAARKRQAE